MNATITTFPSTLKLKIDLTDEQFFQMCQKNRDYRFERTASGELLIMPPTGSDTGNRNFDMVVELGIWNKTGVRIQNSEYSTHKGIEFSGENILIFFAHLLRGFNQYSLPTRTEFILLADS
ncbi:MAG: Uma2 family endonuclease [Nostoc sp.]|uniref:Uma2 family endonuclease n=1 Tax=Nostoc sp. TaxID=1180 RepID=UPI002FF07D73